ncbi:MAG: methyl-accepting chemotaxis protein [Burkholderiaceae bacterium]|nr:methyl-accepting chemotaxis protein [Burkholderiaceae bacterium]
MRGSIPRWTWGGLRKLVLYANDITANKETLQQVQTIADRINGLAMETNLLSLNAACVRASTARGFSVVVEEVHSLSQRSTDSAKEISGMLRSLGTKPV